MKTPFHLALFSLFLLSSLFAHAQQTKNHFRKGNELYKEGKYNEAEIEYRKGLARQPDSWTGNYNLANALYKQKRYKEAGAVLDSLAPNATADNQKGKVYHNLGNAYLENKEYEKSVDAYKKALKINPKDEDTRYNLSYALKKLQQQQQQQQQKKQQEQKQEKKENKDNQEKKEEKKQQISREEAERILDALNRDEKELRKRAEKKEGKVLAPVNGKDW